MQYIMSPTKLKRKYNLLLCVTYTLYMVRISLYLYLLILYYAHYFYTQYNEHYFNNFI